MSREESMAREWASGLSMWTDEPGLLINGRPHSGPPFLSEPACREFRVPLFQRIRRRSDGRLTLLSPSSQLCCLGSFPVLNQER